MKTSNLLQTLLFSLVLLSFVSCEDKCTEVTDFVRYVPVFIDQAEYERPVSMESAQEIVNPGVIASYGDYLYINEFNEGIHVINNSDPTAPVNEAFIAINNNKHFSISDGRVLANRYGDLVSVDIRNRNNVREVSRTANVFPDEAEITPEGLISHYERTSERVSRDCEDAFFGSFWREGNDIFVSDASFDGAVMTNSQRTNSLNNNSNTSVSSSTARFTITKNTLYVLNSTSLEVFNISDPSAPVLTNTTGVGGGVETLFPLNDYLFIGANAGMSIYDVSNAETPMFLSQFEHAVACDPVVADERTAYVTLRSGNRCAGIVNELQVINIENIRSPQRTARLQLDNPRGLAVMGEHLMICDGDDGVVTVNVSNQMNPVITGRFSQEHANDILQVADNIVVVSGENGIYELDITDINNPKLISNITR